MKSQQKIPLAAHENIDRVLIAYKQGVAGEGRKGVETLKPNIDRWIDMAESGQVTDWDDWTRVGKILIKDIGDVAKMPVPGLLAIVSQGLQKAKEEIKKSIPWGKIALVAGGVGLVIVVAAWAHGKGGARHES